jgi:hypothetical protein
MSVLGTLGDVGLLGIRAGVVGMIGGDRRVVMSGVVGLGGRIGKRRPVLGGTTRRFRKGSLGPSSIVV